MRPEPRGSASWATLSSLPRGGRSGRHVLQARARKRTAVGSSKSHTPPWSSRFRGRSTKTNEPLIRRCLELICKSDFVENCVWLKPAWFDTGKNELLISAELPSAPLHLRQVVLLHDLGEVLRDLRDSSRRNDVAREHVAHQLAVHESRTGGIVNRAAQDVAAERVRADRFVRQVAAQIAVVPLRHAARYGRRSAARQSSRCTSRTRNRRTTCPCRCRFSGIVTGPPSDSAQLLRRSRPPVVAVEVVRQTCWRRSSRCATGTCRCRVWFVPDFMTKLKTPPGGPRVLRAHAAGLDLELFERLHGRAGFAEAVR